LADSEVAGLSVTRSRHDLGACGAQSFRYSFVHPCPRTRLLERSSHGVRLHFTAYPKVPAHGLSTEGTSQGLPPLQRSSRRESTSQPVTRPSSPVARESTSGFHAASYGVARRFSQPLSDLFPLPNVLPFSGRWRSGGSRFRGLIRPRNPGNSSPPACSLDVALAGCAAPVPRRGRLQA